MSSGGSNTSTTSSASTLDPFTKDVLTRNITAATNVANLPYEAYTGPRIAGFRPSETASFDLSRAAAEGRVGSAELAAATEAARRAAGYTPAQFQADVAGYMSPYQQNVVDATMARLSQARAERDAATKANLAASKAFGNERRGVYEAQLAGEQDRTTAETLANLYNQGYGQAAGLATGALDRSLSAADRLSSLGSGKLALEQAYANMLSATGEKERAMAQSNLDLAYKDFLEQRSYPEDRLRILLSGTSGVPATTSTTSSTTTPGSGFLGTASDITGVLAGMKKLGIF